MFLLDYSSTYPKMREKKILPCHEDLKSPKAEIAQFDLTLLRDQNVFRLHVSMDALEELVKAKVIIDERFTF